MKNISPEDKERIDEFLSDLDAPAKAYAMDCLKGKAVERDDPEEKAESDEDKKKEGHIPLDDKLMFEDEMHDNPEHKEKSGKKMDKKEDEEDDEDEGMGY